MDPEEKAYEFLRLCSDQEVEWIWESIEAGGLGDAETVHDLPVEDWVAMVHEELNERKRETKPEEWSDFETDSELMTLDEFRGCIDSGSFIDYDGFGYLATSEKCSNRVTYSSLFRTGRCKEDLFSERKLPIPNWATHIVWFNR